MIKLYTHETGDFRLPMSEVVHALWHQYFMVTNNIHQCTYLNSGLLMEPRENVLHGLGLGMY
jgi:hypothetical protein